MAHTQTILKRKTLESNLLFMLKMNPIHIPTEMPKHDSVYSLSYSVALSMAPIIPLHRTPPNLHSSRNHAIKHLFFSNLSSKSLLSLQFQQSHLISIQNPSLKILPFPQSLSFIETEPQEQSFVRKQEAPRWRKGRL